MYLTRIELQGFKSFADKTAVELPAQNNGKKSPLTAIVGPNGSGKSNIADAMRWVLGEQSLKAVRGGKSEDVIFFGTSKRGRAGFAEVALVFNNEGKRLALDQPEVEIARRLYRDGTSEYLINNAVSRLMDIHLLLAKANFGKESYSVIAQGMIDHLILMGGVERRTFFDEATGVHHLQIKKDQAIKKLTATYENLKRAKLLQEEIEPRLRSLTRQVKRLEEKEEITKELFVLQKDYYAAHWRDLEKGEKSWQEKLSGLEKLLTEKRREMGEFEEKLKKAEHEETESETLLKLQENYRSLLEKKQRLREVEFTCRRKQLLASQAKKNVSLDVDGLYDQLQSICREYDEFIQNLGRIKNLSDLETLKQTVAASTTRLRALLKSLKGEEAGNQNAEKELKQVQVELETLEVQLNKIQKELTDLSEREKQKKSSFFEVQRHLLQKQEERHEIERQSNDVKIELAKIGVEKSNLDEEMAADLGEKKEEVKRVEISLSLDKAAEILPEMQRLKKQLDWIGGIDPEIVKEYNETKERHTFLETQCGDLDKSLVDLVELANNLELDIKKQFENGFEKINVKFDEYFKILFNGGQAKLVKVMAPEKEEEDEEGAEEEAAGQLASRTVKEETVLDKLISKATAQGIEIQANPPGKKLKNISMLSGGEKALTSVALLSAILSVNPPPFLLLDEVDAALDEGNSVRFARILNELAARTQLLVITHNRATMQAADLLYGVAMEKEGISKIVSLKLEEGIEMAR
ncbi:MAG: AAA family ATPase [bacterium]|nr:AAA family ATPase [bacterium]